MPRGSAIQKACRLTGRRVFVIAGSVALVPLAALILLWVLPAGADHKVLEDGNLVAVPRTVSPGEANVTTADRTITIRLTDPNLNGPLFMGTGPNGETADPSVSAVNGATLASGDRITVAADGVTAVPPNSPGPFLVALAANPIGPGGSTPMADSDDDGNIDVNDIFVVDADCNDDGFDDISVASLFDGSRGLVNFTMVQAGCGGQGFEVRYATTGVGLTRDTRLFAEGVAIPQGGLVDGEAFTLDLNIDNLPLQDTDGSGVVDAKDITVTVPGRTSSDTPVVTSIGNTASLANPASGLAAGNQITLVHSGGALAAGTSISVQYLGLEDLVTVTGADPAEKVPLRMRETGPDTGVFEATLIAIDGSLHDANEPNDSLDPTSANRPLLAVIGGGAITVRYEDRLPPKTITARVEVEATCNGLAGTHIGTPADDTITGTPGRDVIVGLGGSDIILGLGGNDTICAGPGDDVVKAGPGSDWVSGGRSDDFIGGGAGNDRLFGAHGDDVALGGKGDDTIRCGPSIDFANGGPGTDTAAANYEVAQKVP